MNDLFTRATDTRYNGITTNSTKPHFAFKTQEDPSFTLAKNGFAAIGLTYLLVMLAITALSIWLALAVSPWFFIGTVIAGGYSLIVAVVIVVQRVILNSMSKDW
jgi:hypothetical protein